MEQQAEIPEIKEIEEQQVPEVEPVIARVKAAYILALELIRADKDVRYYLNGINVKPHPVLPGVLLTATNGHMAMMIHDEQGYASREFTLVTSKQLINCCKIKGTLTGSEWVEVNGQEISVVKSCKYRDNDQMGLPAVEKPLVEYVNGIFSFEEIDGDQPFPDVVSRVIPDLSEYTALEGGYIGVNAEYLFKVKKAFLLATGMKEVHLGLRFKDTNSSIYVSCNFDNVAAVVMPARIDDYSAELPEFLKTMKEEASE